MTRFLDWLDESAAGLIRIAYLLAGVIAVANYFSDGNVPQQFSAVLNAILPWALAAALEIHTYLTARRVRKAWQDWSASHIGSDEHERAWAQLKLNLGILSALLTFSMYNQLQYLAQTWTPPHTPLTPPGPWAYLIRAIITPAAFMAAAFLAPVGEGLALQVQSQGHQLALATFKVATQQWKRRLKQMQQAGQDVTGALVQLVDDPAERRVIEAIWQAMQHPALPAPQLSIQATDVTVMPPPAPLTVAGFEATEQAPTATPEAQQSTAMVTPDQPLLSAEAIIEQVKRELALANYPPVMNTGDSEASEASTDDNEPLPPVPPTDGGSPSFASKRNTQGVATTPLADNVTPMRRGLGRAPRAPQRDRRVVNRANARGGKRGSAEQRVRRELASNPGIDFDDLVRRAKVAPSTASKYIAVIQAEKQAHRAAR